MNYDHQSAGDHIGSQLGRASINKPMMDHSIGQISSGIASAKLGETPGAMENLGRLIAELYAIEEKSASLASRIGGGGGENAGLDGTSTAAPATLATQTVILLSLASDISARLDRCLRNL